MLKCIQMHPDKPNFAISKICITFFILWPILKSQIELFLTTTYTHASIILEFHTTLDFKKKFQGTIESSTKNATNDIEI